MKKILLFTTLLGLLSACIQQLESVPTALPPNYLSTVVGLTGQAAFATTNALTPTMAVSETPTPTQTPIPTSSLPSPTPTYEAGFTKFADMRFVAPGPMSSLVSPIDLKLLLSAGKSDLVKIDLLGEDGRMLYTDLMRVDHGQPSTYRNFEVEFEIRAVSEKGYLRLSTKDLRGNLQALNTMPVLLYSIGNTQLNLPGNMVYERVRFKDLKNGSEIYAGELNLKGRYWPFNEQPVFLDLILLDGKVLTSRILDFKGIDPEDFETSLPYKVTEPTIARLAIHQDNPDLSIIDPILKKYIYFYSIEVLLYP